MYNWLLLCKLMTIDTLTDYFYLIVGLYFCAFFPTLGENCEMAYYYTDTLFEKQYHETR